VTKQCKVCGEVKVLDDFYRSRGMRDGFRSDCKQCNLEARRLKNAADPQPNRDRVKRWQAANRERYRAKQREYAKSGRRALANRKSYLKRKYGISVEEYERMLERQNGRCAVCRQPPTGVSLHVDHDHESGRIRGLLCFTCNNSLGDMKDSEDRLAAAIDYLGRHDDLVRVAQERAKALLA
jgi:hypothetical protein